MRSGFLSRLTKYFLMTTTRWKCIDASQGVPRSGLCVSGSVRRVLSVGTRCFSGSDRQFCYYTHWKHEEFRVACGEGAQCADAFKFNMSFVLKYCACAFVVFIAGYFTLAVNDNMHSPFQGPFFRSLSSEKLSYRTRGTSLASKD
jgi:hypothetical protein